MCRPWCGCAFVYVYFLVSLMGTFASTRSSTHCLIIEVTSSRWSSNHRACQRSGIITISLSVDLLHCSSSKTVKGFSILSEPPWMHKKGSSNYENFSYFDTRRMLDRRAHVVEVQTLPEYIKGSIVLYFCKLCFVLWLRIGFIVWNFGSSIPPSIITFLRNPLFTGLSLNAGFKKMHPLIREGFRSPTWKAIKPPMLRPFRKIGIPGFFWMTCSK